MRAIPERELRNDVAGVLRQAERGEEIVITMSGRAVAQLGPVRVRREVPAADARAALAGLARPTGVLEDL